MATISDVLEGMQIIAKHMSEWQKGLHGVGVGHDQIFFGDYKSDMPAEDLGRLEALGWFEEEGAWSTFV